MEHKRRKDNGNITIEAAISLTAFMFAIVTILTIVNICIVQARITYAINATAKELSQYSYLYSLTGFSKSEEELKNAAGEGTQDIDKIMSDVNTVFNEIEKLGNTGKQSDDDTKSISDKWNDVVGSLETMEDAGSKLEEDLSEICKDPKQLMFGIAKLAASEGLELGKSRLIAAPLSKALVKKHLINSEDGSEEDYLRKLGVVPDASGSCMGGLDFSKSTLFPYGSNEITVHVSYDVKVIPLLPIDFTFHFDQTAVTHGWLAGEVTYKTAEKYTENKTLWTQSTVKERSELIRNMGIREMMSEGYQKTSGLTDVPLYNENTNEFAMIASMNPLWSGEGESVKTLADLDDDALQESVERLAGKMMSTTDGKTTVKVKVEVNGTVQKQEKDCSGASNKIVLVIPEDEGLKEKIESVIAVSNTRGVTFEVVQSYGNGAAKSLVKEEGGAGE